MTKCEMLPRDFSVLRPVQGTISHEGSGSPRALAHGQQQSTLDENTSCIQICIQMFLQMFLQNVSNL